ncbi:hypothetical protein I3760_03G146100 [Carya illinoinensis]|nr:hypothetical protein I3760_03G146100 [Carya illinoinensis]
MGLSPPRTTPWVPLWVQPLWVPLHNPPFPSPPSKRRTVGIWHVTSMPRPDGIGVWLDACEICSSFLWVVSLRKSEV